MISFYDIAKVVQASNDYRAFENVDISNVEFDSRKVSAGTLFVPLIGNTDGHDYYETAQKNGAVATFWSKSEPPKSGAYLQVEDTLVALQTLAKWFLAKSAAKVVAITGSNGKTTTKDLTASVLSQKMRTYKTQGNFNNEIGLPYTILKMPEDTQCLVLEMGMSEAGEIAFLSELAQPDVAAITLIGESHLEFFGTRKGIAQAKMEIVTGLKEDGLLLVPANEPLLTPLIAGLSQKIKTFYLGAESHADLFATIIKEEQHRTVFTLSFLPGEFEIPVSGSFNVKNALIASYFGLYFGLSATEIALGLRNVELTQNRSQWLEHNDIQILSDTYNANPTAMALAIESFSQFATPGKKIAVLGDMLELGKTAPQLHASLALTLDPEKIQTVFLYGTEMKALADALENKYPTGAVHYYAPENKAELETAVVKAIDSHDFVFVKASNGMHLDSVVKKIMEK